MVERKRDRLYGAIFFIILGIVMFGVGYYMGTEESFEETVYLLIIGPFFVVFGIFLGYAYYAPEKFERFRQKISFKEVSLEKEKDPEKVRRNKIILVAVIIIVIFIIIGITLGTLYGDWD